GQSALYAYAAHVVLAIPVALLVDSLTLPDRLVGPFNGVIQIVSLLIIWLLIRLRVLFVSPNRGWARYAWPAAATIACLVLLPLDPSPTVPGLASATVEPDPYASRVARAFGTPVPGRPPRGADTPVALPRPSLRRPLAQHLPSSERPASPYVGQIRGLFRNMEFYSPSLSKEMPYLIYLPPDYET